MTADAGDRGAPLDRPGDDAGPRDHGFVAHGLATRCTRDALVRLFSVGEAYREVDAVWTPQTGGPVAPVDCPLVVETFARRVRREAKAQVTALAPLLAVAAATPFLAPPGSSGWILLLPIGLVALVPLVEAAGRWARPAASARRRLADLGVMERLGELVHSSRPLATWALLGLLVVVFVVQSSVGGEASVRAAGLVKDRVREEPWRLVTAALLHGHPLHLLMNGMALSTLGRLTEALAHRAHALVVFLVSAVAGSVASTVSSPHASVGASGGLMGLLGFLTTVSLLRRRELPRVLWRSLLVNVALMAAIGVAAARWIDNAAHAGGLVAGAGLGLLLRSPGRRIPLAPPAALRAGAWAAAAVLVAGAAWAVARMAAA